MPDYLNRMVNKYITMPKNVSLRCIDFDEEGRYWITSDGELWSFCREEPRKKNFNDNGQGYLYTQIGNKKYYLHRLLALSFNASKEKEKIKDDCVVHHLNRDVKDNSLDNLCIMTKEKHQAVHNIWRFIDSQEHTYWE